MDFWTTQNVCCYCGSMSPSEFIQRVGVGQPVRMIKETKMFVFDDGAKFHFRHASPDEQREIMTLHKAGKIVTK